MDLKQRIIEDMQAAMRARDGERLESIRFLRAAIQRREVDERRELDDDGVLAVVQTLIKQGRDAAAQFEQGGRADLVARERRSLEIFEAYLPAQLDQHEIAAAVRAAIAETGASAPKDIGRVMGLLKPRLQGRAEMGAVSALVREALRDD